MPAHMVAHLSPLQGGWYNTHTSHQRGDTPIPSGISDTNPTAEQVQIALLRQAGMARRVDLAAELTSFAIEGAYTALRIRYPKASVMEIKLLFVEQQYGLELAHRLRAALMPSAGEQNQ